MLLGVALVVGAFLLAENRRFDSRDLGRRVIEQQELLIDLTELTGAVYQAESAQRGYLLTGFEGYLSPYTTAVRIARERSATLSARGARLAPESLPELELIQQRLAGKLSEMDTTIEMRRRGRLPMALSLVNADVGLSYTREIQIAFDALRSRQEQIINESLREWDASVIANMLINAAMTVFTLLILLLTGLLASREIGRRTYISKELERQVNERTAELRSLSEQLMRVSETEKYSLSRELHDELGGLLVAMKMELASLKRKCPPDAQLSPLWSRLETSMDAGVDLKRRVIESLRPTLLDNLGLVAALRWQAGETCAKAGIDLQIRAPENEIQLEPEPAIAIFRAVQESFTNIVKHSHATRAWLVIDPHWEGVTIRIADNGVGIDPESLNKSGSHGLRQMEFRMRAIGAQLSIGRAPEGGTETLIRYRSASAGSS